jgi:hypothetical protein
MKHPPLLPVSILNFTVVLGPHTRLLTKTALALTTAKGHNPSHLVVKIVPADATIVDLQKKAAEYEETAKTEPGRTAIGPQSKVEVVP